MRDGVLEEILDLPGQRLVLVQAEVVAGSLTGPAGPGGDDLETLGGVTEHRPAAGDPVVGRLQLIAEIAVEPAGFPTHGQQSLFLVTLAFNLVGCRYF